MEDFAGLLCLDFADFGTACSPCFWPRISTSRPPFCVVRDNKNLLKTRPPALQALAVLDLLQIQHDASELAILECLKGLLARLEPAITGSGKVHTIVAHHNQWFDLCRSQPPGYKNSHQILHELLDGNAVGEVQLTSPATN